MISGRETFDEHLLAGESIVWNGAPAQGLLLTGRDVFLIPFSLLWLGFVCFWLFQVSTAGGSLMFHLFGLVFLAVGLSISFGRFALDAYVRANTAYAVTTQRVLISRRGLFSDFTAVALDRLPVFKLKPGADGRGSIVFGETPGAYAHMSIWTPSLAPTPQFLGIPDVTRVYNLIQTRVGQA